MAWTQKGVGWHDGSNKAQNQVCLSVCVLESTARKEKCTSVVRCYYCKCTCMVGRKKKMPSAILVCLLVQLIVQRLHAVWIMLGFQTFSKKVRKKKKIKPRLDYTSIQLGGGCTSTFEPLDN